MIKMYFYLFALMLLIIGCELGPNCDYNKKLNKSIECLAVVVSKPVHSNVFLKNGYNPYTKKECNCEENDRWMRIYYDEMDIGDTIVKKKGDLFFQIHKTDTVITHFWKCDQKVYK
ncbi:hypothetical protein ABEG63_13830 [Chryseobacterium sp. C39-AII1]|uniref:hypothetical protein n=1 Tax=Chryseobacterium sp. C39-AII1 TaxID=3080332 RepID=UPI003209CC4F